jgi:hypothetical protein
MLPRRIMQSPNAGVRFLPRSRPRTAPDDSVKIDTIVKRDVQPQGLTTTAAGAVDGTKERIVFDKLRLSLSAQKRPTPAFQKMVEELGPLAGSDITRGFVQSRLAAARNGSSDDDQKNRALLARMFPMSSRPV